MFKPILLSIHKPIDNAWDDTVDNSGKNKIENLWHLSFHLYVMFILTAYQAKHSISYCLTTVAHRFITYSSLWLYCAQYGQSQFHIPFKSTTYDVCCSCSSVRFIFYLWKRDKLMWHTTTNNSLAFTEVYFT